MEYIIPAASAIVVAVKNFNHAKFSLQNIERSLSRKNKVKESVSYEKTLFRIRRKWLKYFLVLVIKRKILLSR